MSNKNTDRGDCGDSAADQQEQRSDQKEKRPNQTKSKFSQQPVEVIQSFHDVKGVSNEKSNTDPKSAHRCESIEPSGTAGGRELHDNETGQIDYLYKTNS